MNNGDDIKDKVVPRNSEASDDAFDNDVYGLVAASARLSEISLVKGEYAVVLSCFMERSENGKKLSHGFSGELHSYTFDQETGVLIGSYTWKAEIKYGRKKALKLNAEYFLSYNGLLGADPEYAKIYFSKIARFTSYPYFRSLFAMNTMNSGLFLPPLPSLTDRVD